MNKVISILLVEDDQLDAMNIQRSLNKLNILCKITHARNGEEAINLMNEWKNRNVEAIPDIILMDINMPRMNGLELLQVIRSNEAWKHIKCFIITTSDEKVDRDQASGLNVSGFIVKPFRVNNPSSADSINLMIDLINMKA